MAITGQSEDFASGQLRPGQTHFWFADNMPFGQIPVFSVQALGGAPTEKRVAVTRVYHLTKVDGSIQVNVEVTNIVICPQQLDHLE